MRAAHRVQRFAGGDRTVAEMVDNELNELKREFLDEAREKVEEMQTAAERVRESEALERLAYLAHQLKGSGGSYGYQSISDDAAALEKAVESLNGHDERAAAALGEKIRLHVTNLRSEIETASKELS